MHSIKSTPADGERGGRSVPRVVFVCVENSNRSQLAEAFARQLGAEAYSAGSRPSGRINPKAVAALAECGYDLTTHRSKSLGELPDVLFDAAITMGCGDTCPQLQARLREDWSIPDPRDLTPDEYRAVRDLIQAKVHELLTRITQEKL